MNRAFLFVLVANGLAFFASFGLEHKNNKKIEQRLKVDGGGGSGGGHDV
jgi:hypothetical protein